jgi:hypothetical protein
MCEPEMEALSPNSRTRKDCDRPFRQPSMTVLVEPIEELVAGVEPASPEYETGVLPLNYASTEGASEEPAAG